MSCSVRTEPRGKVRTTPRTQISTCQVLVSLSLSTSDSHLFWSVSLSAPVSATSPICGCHRMGGGRKDDWRERHQAPDGPTKTGAGAAHTQACTLTYRAICH